MMLRRRTPAEVAAHLDANDDRLQQLLPDPGARNDFREMLLASARQHFDRERIPPPPAAAADRIRHWCGTAERHPPHIGCNGFGYDAGPPQLLCRNPKPHTPHTSCDGQGATPPEES